MHNMPYDNRRQRSALAHANASIALASFVRLRLANLAMLCFMVCFIAAIVLMQMQTAEAGPRGGRFNQPFSRYANQDPLQAVLLDFAQTQGYRAVVTPGVEGVISGRFDAVPPGTFLDGIRAAFGISWYTLGNTVYFYSEAQSTRMFISPRATQPEVMFEALRSSGVLSPELSAELAPGGQMIRPDPEK